MEPKAFYHRSKVRLGDFRAVRGELCAVYRACVAKTLDWSAGRDAAAILSKIAALDQGTGFEARIAAIEAAIEREAARPKRTNGNGAHVDARP